MKRQWPWMTLKVISTVWNLSKSDIFQPTLTWKLGCWLGGNSSAHRHLTQGFFNSGVTITRLLPLRKVALAQGRDDHGSHERQQHVDHLLDEESNDWVRYARFCRRRRDQPADFVLSTWSLRVFSNVIFFVYTCAEWDGWRDWLTASPGPLAIAKPLVFQYRNLGIWLWGPAKWSLTSFLSRIGVEEPCRRMRHCK